MSACADGYLKVWDARLMAKEIMHMQAQKTPMTSMAVHPRVPVLATGSHNQFINVSASTCRKGPLLRLRCTWTGCESLLLVSIEVNGVTEDGALSFFPQDFLPCFHRVYPFTSVLLPERATHLISRISKLDVFSSPNCGI